jgi:hypothetical protein
MSPPWLQSVMNDIETRLTQVSQSKHRQRGSDGKRVASRVVPAPSLCP